MADEILREQPNHPDPAIAQRSPAGWRVWVRALLTRGQDRLAALGAVLSIGLAVGLGSIAFFGWLAGEVARRQTQQLDDAVLAWMRQADAPWLADVARGISLLGSEALTGFVLLLVLFLGWRRQWGAAVGVVLVVVGAQVLNGVLKDTFQRARPTEVATYGAQVFSFPSGHAMVSAAFYGYLAYLGARMLRRTAARAGWVSLMLLVVLLIGISRMYLAVHYFTDVVAGYVTGFAWADAVILGGHTLSGRLVRRPPGARRRARPSAADASSPSAAWRHTGETPVS